ncbi:Zn-dependent hydrolase [Virgibacillus sp. W0181]|uniref:Zn-dependent hydrolase n=1 Tax=Virgibacillus sp. W0181 TaxID=3391581 RepID=UPI003F48FE36
MVLTINESRFLKNFAISSSIGATKHNGLHRLTLSKEDKQMRDVYKKQLQEAGLKVRIDDYGNMYARREGRQKNAPAVTFGSHLDTQFNGGRFDGVLGVLAGLEVMEILNDKQIETDFPLELINFTNEEGARFNPPIIGSGAVTGQFSKDYVYNLQDEEGVRFEDALTDIGYKGKEENRLGETKCFVELHIEQGPILENENKDIGIVQGLQGLTRLNVVVNGFTNHAGGARMKDRKDALLAAAHMIVTVNKMTEEIEGLRITVGKINNYPNSINVIPGKVSFVIDIRHPNDEMKNKSVKLIQERLQKVAGENNVTCETNVDWAYDMVPFDQEIIEKISDSSKELNYSMLDLYGGPGHDAKYMSTYTPTGLIFVKSIDGISHNENELTEDGDLIKGANVLLNTILKLATN